MDGINRKSPDKILETTINKLQNMLKTNGYFIEIDKKYICLHISKTWDSRTYSSENWQTIITHLEQLNYYVVLIGNNASEVGFFNINKTVHNLKLNNGLSDKLSSFIFFKS